jgi:hypothetical protein
MTNVNRSLFSELVRVCSCAADECNIHDDLHTAALSGVGGCRMPPPLAIVAGFAAAVIFFPLLWQTTFFIDRR